MFIIQFFIISIFAIIISYIFKETFAKTLPSAIFIIPIILYIAGLFGNLLYGIFAIYTICIIAIFYFIYLLFFQNKNEQNKYKLMQLKNIIISPSLIVFFILFILIFIYNINSYFSNWDEWTHWGPYVKDMFFRNKFYNTKFHIAHTHLSYPPFKQLFEYFYCKIVFNLTEPNMYRAYQLLCFSLCFMMFSNVKFTEEIENNIKNIIIMFLIVLYFIFMNRIVSYDSIPTHSIYADSFLGLSFGYFMVNILQFDFNDKFKNFNLVVSEIALIFSKQMGGGWFLIGFFTLFVIVLVNKKLSIKILIKGIILFLIPILFFISWKIIVFKNGITDQFDLDKININGLINILFKRIGEDWQIETYNNFIDFIFNNKFMGLTTFLWWVLLSVALIITSIVFFKKYGNKIIIVSISMSIGFLLNLFALLCLYFYTFSPYEATNLASVWRYTSPYILGLVFFLSFILIEDIILNFKNINFKVIIMLFLVSILYLSIHFANTVDYKPKKIEDDYKIKYKKDFNYVRDLPKDSKTLIISNGVDWYNSIKFNYYYLEKKLYFVSNSYGKKIYEDAGLNQWTIDIDKNELLQYIKTFDYIYFYNADDNFIDNYGELFKFIPENREGVYLVSEILK